ncbi:MAG TPA: DUF2007 domain-containing protein [Vicinamibacterales bacterium]|nr:DUF2007 domain-containing protein [Vicinamibacterales bacterium]
MGHDSIEAIGNFLNRVDAELARGALDAEGIEATVSADDAAGTRPHLWMGGVRLLVRAGDVERARQILQTAEAVDTKNDTKNDQ